MLNRNSLVAGLPLTQSLEDAKLALYPIQGTPLDALCNATRSDESLFDAAQGDVNRFISHVEVMANKVQQVYGSSHHTATLDAIAADAIAATNKHLSFAKNVVRPVINDLYTRVKESLAEVNPSALLGMEVKILREPAPLENAQLQNEVRKFSGLTIEDLPLTLRLPDQEPEALLELVQTGSAQLDSAIAEWLSHDAGLLSYVWSHVFQQKPLDDPKTFLAMITDREYGLFNALAIYLFARKLTSGKPLEGTEMSLGKYQQDVVQFRNQAGGALARGLDRIARQIKLGILVRDSIGAETTVYEPVYRQFLEQGGSNEVLFANSMSGRNMVALKDILAAKGQLAESWNMHAALAKTADANKRFDKTKQLIALHFNSQLSEIANSEEGTAANIEGVRKLFKTVMANVKDSDVNDLYNLCMKVVCRARFYKTDSELILQGISDAKRDNPQLSIREAATVSAIKYAAGWVARQMKLVSI